MPDSNDIVFNQYSIDFTAILRAVIELFSGTSLSADDVLRWLSTAWDIFVIVSLLLAFLFFIGFIYASTRYNELSAIEKEGILEDERLYRELFHGTTEQSRLADIEQHITSDNPNDWKLAIIEADIELEKVLAEKGYVGATIGEKLKGASSNGFQTLDDAWEAHKVRNKIAHQSGEDFVLTKKLAQDTIQRYRRVFAEFGVA